MKPELDGGEWTPPRTTTPYLGNAPGEDPLAEMRIRRLANRHGHTREIEEHQDGDVTTITITEVCPDPAAHARDAADLAVVLEACGFIPYKPGRPPAPPAGCATTHTSYRRPGA